MVDLPGKLAKPTQIAKQAGVPAKVAREKRKSRGSLSASIALAIEPTLSE